MMAFSGVMADFYNIFRTSIFPIIFILIIFRKQFILQRVQKNSI